MKQIISVLAVLILLVASCCSPNKKKNNADAPERNLEPLHKSFLENKFGMFIHFNMSSFFGEGSESAEWSTGKEDPLFFNPEKLDCNQWAEAASSANMKYAVFTVKHTGGWCLWNSAYTDHDISAFKNFRDGKGDLVKEYCEAFRKQGIKIGFYYCFPVWDERWATMSTLPIEGFSEGKGDVVTFVKNQFTELLSNYGDIDYLWCDQHLTPNGGFKEGDFLEIKKLVHSLQPNCLVIGNNSQDFEDSDIHSYEFPWSKELPPVDNKIAAEVSDKIQDGWFYGGDETKAIRTVEYYVDTMLTMLNSRNCNYLLNCAPSSQGLIPDDVVEMLKKIGEIQNVKLE
jgi:alpha-L-fucosidase